MFCGKRIFGIHFKRNLIVKSLSSRWFSNHIFFFLSVCFFLLFFFTWSGLRWTLRVTAPSILCLQEGLFKWLTCLQHGTPSHTAFAFRLKDPWFLQMLLMPYRAGSRQRSALEKVQRFPRNILEGGPHSFSTRGGSFFGWCQWSQESICFPDGGLSPTSSGLSQNHTLRWQMSLADCLWLPTWKRLMVCSLLA